jgi:peptidoglycan-N-acetylglucosamine deacetylase
LKKQFLLFLGFCFNMSKFLHNFIFGLMTCLFACEETTFSANEQSIYIAKFPGDKSAAVSFTFDDNCPSSLTTIAPLFERYGYPATFFVIPGTIKSDEEWFKWKTLSDRGFEIGNHSMSHRNLTTLDSSGLREEINASFELIKAKLNKAPLSFAPPGHGTSDLVNSFIAEKHRFNRVVSRDFCVSQGWISSTTRKDALSHIQESISHKRWYVVTAHGIGDGWEPITESMLKTTLDYCKAHDDQVSVETFQNISLYTQARQNATLSVTKGSNNLFIRIESPLPADNFSYPLTLVIKDHTFPLPYKIYNFTTGELLEPNAVSGKKLLIQVYVNNIYEIRWRDR